MSFLKKIFGNFNQTTNSTDAVDTLSSQNKYIYNTSLFEDKNILTSIKVNGLELLKNDMATADLCSVLLGEHVNGFLNEIWKKDNTFDFKFKVIKAVKPVDSLSEEIWEIRSEKGILKKILEEGTSKLITLNKEGDKLGLVVVTKFEDGRNGTIEFLNISRL